MADNILGIKKDTFYALLLLLLLLILGIVTFNYYIYVSGNNGLNIGTGFDISLFPNRQANNQQQQQAVLKQQQLAQMMQEQRGF